MILAIAVGFAASLGAVARYLLDRVVQQIHDSTLPWGTFVINITGSLLLGLVTGLSLHHGLPARPTTVIGIGLLGGYTTWSTFAWETVALVETRALLEASFNVVASLALGLAAAAAGLGLALL